MNIGAFLNPINLTIILLTLVVTTSSYFLNIFPTNILIAVAATALFDIFLQKTLKNKIRMPSAAIISGIIIGAIAPINSAFYVVILAGIIAVASKYFIRYNGTPIFNPAALGLLISLFVFSLTDVWWATTDFNLFGHFVSFSPVLLLCAYRAKKLVPGASFLLAFIVISFIVGSFHIEATFNGVISYAFSLPYLFAFVMVSELKTAPHKTWQQILFGAGIAVVLFALAFYAILYSLLISLLAANLVYFIYRKFLWRNIFNLKSVF